MSLGVTGPAVQSAEYFMLDALTLRSTSGWSRPERSLGSFTVSSLKRLSRSEVCLVLVAASVGEGAAGSCPTHAPEPLTAGTASKIPIKVVKHRNFSKIAILATS